MAQLIKDIRGQNVIESLLQAAHQKTLPHALIFTGSSGVGKKKSAWALAQSLLCKESHPACGYCTSCLKVEKQTSESVFFIQPDGLQIKANVVRQILDFVSLQSFAPARVIIIESAHQMNRAASGSLLKILEEPPNNVYFILVSSHLSALMNTIRSRMQIVRFVPLQEKDIPHRAETKTWMLRACQGRMDLLMELEEKTELRNKAFNLLKTAMNPNSEMSHLNELPDLVRDREQAVFICLCWQQICRDARIAQLQPQRIIHADHSSWIDTLKNIPANILHMMFEQIVQLEKDLKSYVDPVLAFDWVLLRLRYIKK